MRVSNNHSVLACFLAGVQAHNRRKVVCAMPSKWEDGSEGFFLSVGGELIAAHHARFGYVIARDVIGRHARIIRHNLIRLVDGNLTWRWDY